MDSNVKALDAVNSKVKARVAVNKAQEAGKKIRKNAIHNVAGIVQKHPKLQYPLLGLLAVYLLLFDFFLNLYIQLRLNYKIVIGTIVSVLIIVWFANLRFDLIAAKYSIAIGVDVEIIYHWFYLILFVVCIATMLIFTGKQIEIAYAIWAVCGAMSVILYINGNCLFDLLAAILEMVASGGAVMLMLLIKKKLG